MIIPRREDTYHKAQLYRLMTSLLDDPGIGQKIIFKGGTCASMLGFLDRFSIDLDFDLQKDADKKSINQSLKKVFSKIDLEIKEKSRNELFYLLRYQARPNSRNTIKLSIMPHLSRSDIYKPYYLAEIDRWAVCQTVETMFAHKLVALTDRYKKHRMIAGRDLYDIHYFFLEGYHYKGLIITERTGKTVLKYLEELVQFIKKQMTETVISEDLNFLLPKVRFVKIKKILKEESLRFIQDEIKRLKFSKRT